MELSLSDIQVLRLLALIGHPVGYFGLATRLELQRPRLRRHLAACLATLVALGLAEARPEPGYRTHAFAITPAGLEWLATEFPA